MVSAEKDMTDEERKVFLDKLMKIIIAKCDSFME